MSARLTPHRLWIGIFALWAILLSGILHPFTVSHRSPGLLQALQLQQVLDSQQRQIDQEENELLALQEKASLLAKSPITQEREIRRVLGYAASDELIFDFSREDHL